jgi:chemotaxis protein MotB
VLAGGLTAEPKKPRGAPIWLVTFADLMALLFAFFVLILSFSEVDDDSFRRNAGPMAEAFNQPAPTSLVERTSDPSKSVPARRGSWPKNISNDYRIAENRRRLFGMFRMALAEQIRHGTVSIQEFDSYAVLSFPAAKAFAPGSADLNADATATIDRATDVLSRVEGRITVSGHTDDIPIATAQFRSNWELSTARAVSVVHRLLHGHGIDPTRILANGYADTVPVQSNQFAEGRAANRRVEIRLDVPVR